MGYSSLCDSIHRNPSYNHSSGRAGQSVCKITPHHMAARWTGERCAESFDVRGRNASSNYCIGYGGEIVGCVDESDRSWCSSSAWNDNRAITIEIGNSSTGGDWPISDASWNALVRLCADICRRYGFRLEYTGDSSGSLTEHRMFSATNCPGPYLHARMGELARQVNAMLDSGEGPSAPATGGSAAPSGSVTDLANRVIAGEFGNGDARRAALGDRYDEVQAEVNRILGVGGSSSSGSSVDIDQMARDVIAGKYGNGDARKRALGSSYAAVQKRVNEMLGVSVSSSSSDKSWKVGASVQFTNPVDENGTHLAVSGMYTIMQINGNRIVVGRGGVVTAAVPKGNLKLV